MPDDHADEARRSWVRVRQALQLDGDEPVSRYPDGRLVYETLMKLNFMVVANVFRTPTTDIADIVLPAAFPGEYSRLAW